MIFQISKEVSLEVFKRISKVIIREITEEIPKRSAERIFKKAHLKKTSKKPQKINLNFKGRRNSSRRSSDRVFFRRCSFKNSAGGDPSVIPVKDAPLQIRPAGVVPSVISQEVRNSSKGQIPTLPFPRFSGSFSPSNLNQDFFRKVVQKF